MQKRFAQKTAAIAALSRNILTNTAAGLITAALLGFWSPALKKSEPSSPQAVGKVNIDPASGKILDRVDIAGEETAPAPRLKPLLLGYALPALSDPSETESGTESAPQKPRRPRETLAIRTPGAPKPQRPSATEPESRNMAAEAPDPAPAQTAAAEGWMAKIAPGALSAKLAPIGFYVSGGVAAAKRAVADRLEAIGL